MTEFTLALHNLDVFLTGYEGRLIKFVTSIKSIKPDIIILQEVHNSIYEKVSRELRVLGYNRKIPNELSNTQSGELVFSRLPIKSIEYKTFQIPHIDSNQLKGFTICEIELYPTPKRSEDPESEDCESDDENTRSKSIFIVTSQFHSAPHLRRKQLKTIFNISSKLQDAVICGDTGILEYQEFKLPEGLCDAWYEAGKENNKFTLNYLKNPLCPKPYLDRVDRVWYTSSLTPLNYELTDTEDPTSRHFTVLIKFRVN